MHNTHTTRAGYQYGEALVDGVEVDIGSAPDMYARYAGGMTILLPFHTLPPFPRRCKSWFISRIFTSTYAKYTAGTNYGATYRRGPNNVCPAKPIRLCVVTASLAEAASN